MGVKLRLRIPIIPQSWSGRGQTRSGHRYTLPRLKNYEAAIREHWQRTYPDHVPLSGPINLELIFIFPRPKGMMWKSKPMPRAPHTKRPDRTNLVKAVEDALNGIAWRDDAQVYSGNAEKWIADGNEQPCIIIHIEEDTENPKMTAAVGRQILPPAKG
jgi:Holliday junction resolvase RusA-like endonuclease